MELLKEYIKNKDIDKITKFMKEYRLKIDSNKIVPIDAESKINIKKQKDFYDQRQLIKKILLNS
jgi:hypothetical protein